MRIKKRNCINLLATFLTFVEWILFLGLCGASVMLTKGVLNKFMDNKSSFSIEMQEIEFQPTVIICFNGCINKPFELNKDFKIWYGVDDDYSIELHEEENTFMDWEIIELQSLATAYKISSKNYSHRKGQIRTIIITFSNEIPISQLQYQSIKIFITSEANAYGISMGNWMDGEYLQFQPLLGNSVQVSLTSEEFHYLEKKSNCSNQSFYEIWGKAYLNLVKEKCNSTCTSISLPIPNISLCNFSQPYEWYCADQLKVNSFTNFLKSGQFNGPCVKLQYKGKQDNFKSIQDKRSSHFSYKFNTPELTTLHEEFYIYDTTGMIGSVGGSLGMCIGFSFSNIFNWLIVKIRKYLFPNQFEFNA